MSPSGEIVKTRGTVHLTSGNAVYYFHILDDKHLPTVDGIIRREEYLTTSTYESETGFYGSPYGPAQGPQLNRLDHSRDSTSRTKYIDNSCPTNNSGPMGFQNPRRKAPLDDLNSVIASTKQRSPKNLATFDFYPFSQDHSSIKYRRQRFKGKCHRCKESGHTRSKCTKNK